MRIAMVASEAAPFVKTGGLGDVMQALPNALSKLKGNEICLFLPYYKRIKENPAVETEQVGSFSMELAWRESYVGILRLKSRRKKLQVYFIDNDYYFGARSTIYGDFDDGERFAYFSKAVMAALYFLDFKPDILHCHDWQAAMTPAYLRALYHDWCPQTKLVFTIHNVEYQGWADASFFDNILGLPDEYRASLTFDGAINMMKGAIECADMVSTVSETYAQEIRYPYYAHGLDGILSGYWYKLVGITNGVDVSVFDPSTDKALVQNYSIRDFAAGKAANKAAMQRELGLPERPEVPVLAMITRLASHKGIDLLCYIARRLLGMDVQLVILGTGEQRFENFFRGLAAEYPDVEYREMFVDNCAMQICKDPAQFDVIVTENMFGDILSDEASEITGSIGMVPSSSLGDGTRGLYEPIHGSAPDIAGQDIINPIACILSAAMMLRYSFDMAAEADCIEAAVNQVLNDGIRTADIWRPGCEKVGCAAMGDAILARL